MVKLNGLVEPWELQYVFTANYALADRLTVDNCNFFEVHVARTRADDFTSSRLALWTISREVLKRRYLF